MSGARIAYLSPSLWKDVQALPGKVLVVEDNELNLKLFCDLLEVHDYEPHAVRDGGEAIARARAVRPDLIVMDIQLPHVSGLELIAAMKADPALAAIPIMAVTAYASPADEQRARDAGATSYVSKPISLVRFIEAIEALERGDAGTERQSPPVPGTSGL